MGNVLEAFQRFRNMIPKNDGVRKYKQLIKNSYPTSFNGDSEAKISITDREFDITNINDSNITVEGIARYRMDCNGAYDNEPAATSEMCNYVFVGFKSSAQCLRQIQLQINDRPDLCNFLNPNIAQESYLYQANSSETKRENKPGMYSLWDDVWAHSPNVCGVYIPMSSIRRGNGIGTFRFKFIIPIMDILAFQALDMFPSSIMGILSLVVSFQFASAVYCPVSMTAVREQEEYLRGLFALGVYPSKTDCQEYDAQITHEFLQVGTEYGKFMLTDTLNSPTNADLQTMKMNITSFTVEKLKAHLNGYNINEASKQAIARDISSKPVLIPAQKLEKQTFGTGIISSGAFDATISYTPRNVYCISIMFTTHENNTTINILYAYYECQMLRIILRFLVRLPADRGVESNFGTNIVLTSR